MSDIAKKTKKRIEQMLHDKAEEIKELQQSIEQLNERLIVYDGEMEQAALAREVEKYKTFKTKHEEVSTELFVYTTKMNALENKPLVTEEENHETLSELTKLHKKLSEDTRQKVKNLITQLDEIRQEFYKKQNEINDVIEEWDRYIYKQKRILGYKNGEPVYTDVDVRQYDIALSRCLDEAVRSFFIHRLDKM